MRNPETSRPPLAVIFSVTTTGIFANTLVNAGLPDIVDAFDQPDSAAGWFVAAGAVPGVLMAPVIGFLADRFGRRRVLIPCLVGFGVFGVSAGLSPNFVVLLLFRLAQGFGAAGLINLALVLIGDNWTGTDRARVIGYNAAILTFCLAIFPAVGGAITQFAGWRWSFAPFIFALVTAGLVGRFLPRGRPSGSPPSLRSQLARAWTVVKQPIVATSILYGFLFFALIFGLMLTVLPILLAEDLGLEAGARGLVLAAPAVSASVAAISLGRLRRSFSGGALVIAGSLLFGIGFLVIGFGATLALVVVGAVVYGFGEGLSVATLQDVAAGAAEDDTRGSVVAIWVSAVRGGQATGPIAAGVGMDQVGPAVTFRIAAVLPLALAAGLLASPSRRAK